MSTSAHRRAERKSPEQRSAEIGDAARAIALESGLSALTLRAVAARIGVAPALVAHYEPSMDVLVGATFASIVAAEIDDVQAMMAGLPSPTVRIATLVESLLDGSRDDVTVVWVEAWGLGRRNDALAAAVREQMDAWQRVVQDVIESGITAGEFEAGDPAVVAWQLLGMIDGLNAQALVRWSGGASRGSLIHRALEGMLGLRRTTLDAV